jgi:hypothetical protein
MIKKIFLLFVLITILPACESVKDSLSLKKKNSVDEFLIEKKNPLTLPPEFSKLPTPEEKQTLEKEEKDIDFTTILLQNEILENSNEKKESGRLEKSISNILKKND